jgi:hypothetical protein
MKRLILITLFVYFLTIHVPLLQCGKLAMLASQSLWLGPSYAVVSVPVILPIANNNYSETSNKGPTERRTTSHFKGYSTMSQNQQLINLQEEDSLSTKDVLVGPIIWRFHCILRGAVHSGESMHQWRTKLKRSYPLPPLTTLECGGSSTERWTR